MIIDVINDYVNTILKSASLSQCLAQVLYFITTVLMSVLIFMLLYHGMKRQKPIYILYGIGIHSSSLYIAYLGTMTPIWSYCLILLVLAAAYCTGIWFDFRWYHRQQQILLQQRREFKERKNAEYRAKIAAKEEAAKAAAAVTANRNLTTLLERMQQFLIPSQYRRGAIPFSLEWPRVFILSFAQIPVIVYSPATDNSSVKMEGAPDHRKTERHLELQIRADGPDLLQER